MSVKQTFFWYDLETSGINPRDDRIMQFAGQRTDLDLNPVGEPVNILVRLGEDILPAPDAVLLTGITPQQTLAEGVSEVEFLRVFHDEVATPGTIFVGFNSIRFDDEFMRFINYRNFYDAYEWQWKDGRSRWDILDVVRMTRALRPDGIKWPVVDGKPGNRLELLTKANGISHDGAHDALADVVASIDLARLLKAKQPKLFNWLLEYRDKAKIANLVEQDEPFVYSSGKYDNEFEKTTVAVRIAAHPTRAGALVYDLRYDPTPFVALSPEKLAERWQWTREPGAPARLPVKSLQYNRCPAIAPLIVLDDSSEKRVKLNRADIAKNHKILIDNPDFTANILKAQALLDKSQEARHAKTTIIAEGQLYEGFIADHDKTVMGVIRAAEPDELTELMSEFHDERLKELLPRYKARNYAKYLTDEERDEWESYRYHQFMDGGAESRLSRYMHRLGELAETTEDADKRFLLEELQLYAESVLPITDID